MGNLLGLSRLEPPERAGAAVMRIAHILRKYNPAEWGGTETAVARLLNGLRGGGVDAVVYCPAIGPDGAATPDPLAEAGHRVERFRACVPVWGISKEQRRQLVSIGGNLMSFDLMKRLRRAPGLSVIHTHALNRLGGIALTVARARGLPLVVTIHGGVLDLPDAVRQKLAEPLRNGFEWGKVFGWLLRSRQVLARADAIFTCNRREAALLKEKHPRKIIIAQPHGVPARLYLTDHRAEAERAFPHLSGQRILLAAGRIDPVKNQVWLVRQLPRLLERHADAHLVFAGACTDESYGKLLKKEIRNLGLEACATLTGGLAPESPELIGLFQRAAAVLVPSITETFGLVILEAWAAGAPVISSRTSGALELVREGENGWLFDLEAPDAFHAAAHEALAQPDKARALAEAGRQRAEVDFDCAVLARRVRRVYEELADVRGARTCAT